MKRKRKGEEKRFFSKKNKKTKSPKIFCCQNFFSKSGLVFFRQTPDHLHFNGYHVKNIFSKICVINDSRRPSSTVWCRRKKKGYRTFTVLWWKLVVMNNILFLCYLSVEVDFDANLKNNKRELFWSEFFSYFKILIKNK